MRRDTFDYFCDTHFLKVLQKPVEVSRLVQVFVHLERDPRRNNLRGYSRGMTRR